MTTKEHLHDLVEQLGDDQADDLLRLAEDMYAANEQPRKLPRFVGMGNSGRGDLGRHAKEIVRSELDGGAANPLS